jgi:hypothetical protein
MFFLLFLCFSSSLTQNLSFQIVNNDRIDLITDDYPTIIDSSIPHISIDNRIIYFDEKNWTFVKLQIILKSAEGFLLSNQSYLIENTKEEETKGEEEVVEERIFLPFISILICLGIFGILIFKFKKSETKDRYIPNKEKDRLIANEFYEETGL